MVSLQHNAFLTTSQACSLLGLSPNTLRSLADNGEVEFYRTCNGAPTGQRRFSRQSCLEWAGLDESDDNGDLLTIAYCRVSSVGQKNALTNQIEQVVEEVTKREGRAPLVISEICSSFSNRPQLNKLMAMVCEGKVKRVVINYLDRLSRVPALTTMLKSLFERYGVELVVLNTECVEDPNSLQSSMEELTHYICVIANRASGRKAGRLAKKMISQDCIRRGTELLNIHNVENVTSILNAEGYTAENAKGKSKVSRYIVERLILNPLELNRKMKIGSRNLPDSFELFRNAVIRKGGKKDRVRKTVLYQSYLDWLELTHPNERAFSSKRVGEIMVEKKYRKVFTRNGCVSYEIVLNGHS